MSIIYLWKSRERPGLLSKRWIKVWAKRALSLPGLLRINIRRLRYSIKGAKIGHLAILGKLDINGSARRLTVGERSFISTNVHLALHERITVGDRVVVNAGVQLLTGSHDTADPEWKMIAKPIVIEDFVWVATSSIILPGVKIGKGAVVAAGSVISRDVPEYAVVAGNPAKQVGQRSRSLSYSPVDLCAPFEAWLGNPGKQKEVEL